MYIMYIGMLNVVFLDNLNICLYLCYMKLTISIYGFIKLIGGRRLRVCQVNTFGCLGQLSKMIDLF